MRISAICRYFFRRNARRLPAFAGIVLAVSIGILLVMMPFMADVSNARIMFGNREVVIAQGESDKPMLTSPFGTAAFLFYVYMLLFAYNAIQSDRRYLLSNNITRIEYISGVWCSTLGLSAALCAAKYIIDLCCRLATWALGFQIYGSVWDARLILLSDNAYMNDLLILFGSLVMAAGILMLISILFTRWKRTCIVIIVVMILAPIMATNFLPQDWFNWIVHNMDVVMNWALDFYHSHMWLFMQGIPAWQSMLQSIGWGTLCFALCYPVIRRLPVRSK